MKLSRRQLSSGFTIVEMLVVVAIVGAAAAAAIPRLQEMRDNQRLKDIARQVSGNLSIARSLAIQTGNNQIVYFATTAATDACGNPLEDTDGNPVPVLVLDDGEPGTGNCCIDAGESRLTLPMVQGVAWGVTRAPAANPDDAGRGDYKTGVSFANAAGAQTRWVMFRPDGIPVGVSAACVAGRVGSGGGGVYLTNANFDYAAILSPLGAVKVRGFDQGMNRWSD